MRLTFLTAITLTYVPYIVAEMPSNLLMRKVGPKRILPVICFLWGVVASSQSRINSYSGLLACRFFLGLCEGGILPGIILFLSSFYRPHELQLRVGLMFSGTALSGAFSGLLAAAIAPMDGIGGLQGVSTCAKFPCFQANVSFSVAMDFPPRGSLHHLLRSLRLLRASRYSGPCPHSQLQTIRLPRPPAQHRQQR